MSKNPISVIKQEIMNPAIQQSIRDRIGEKAGTFTTSLIDLVGDDRMLAGCDPKLIIKEALKAAALDLPINRNLGFAYVIAYKEKGVPVPQFQMGFKGYIQLAIRTGQYRHLNAGVIYEGEEIIEDRIRGKIEIGGQKTGETAIGYFAYMELINGFNKAVAWTKEQVEAHAKRFSKSYSKGYSSPWTTDFDAMAMKTMILQLIPKYGPLTIQMSEAFTADRGDVREFDEATRMEIEADANSEIIDIPAETGQGDSGALTEAEKAEILAAEAAEAEEQVRAQMENGPGF